MSGLGVRRSAHNPVAGERDDEVKTGRHIPRNGRGIRQRHLHHGIPHAVGVQKLRRRGVAPIVSGRGLLRDIRKRDRIGRIRGVINIRAVAKNIRRRERRNQKARTASAAINGDSEGALGGKIIDHPRPDDG